MINSVALMFVFSCLVFVIGLDCTNRCCYYYSIVPKNVTTVSCNPQGMDINWLCQIYSPHSDNTNLSVQWYKAALETVDTVEGELLSELSGKYSFTTSRRSLTVNQSTLNGLFSDEFLFTIHNFNSSNDDGYYWCQIVANGSCPLEPSPTGYVALDQFPVEKCVYSLLDFIDPTTPPICAEGTLCCAEQQTAIANEEVVNSHTTVKVSNSIISMTVILYGVIGGLFCIIIFLLLIIIACSVCNVRNRKLNTAIRANKAKCYPGQSPNVYNDQPTKFDNDALAMDAPGAKDKQDRKQPILPPSKSANQPIREPIIPTVNAPISSVNEVKYAQPGTMYQPPLNPQEVSSPSVSTQYQGLRASGVEMISAYNIPQVWKDEHIDGEVKADPKYANLPM